MIKLITHTDLDGVGCAILATIVFKNNIDITYCHVPDEVNEYLNKNLNELNTYEKVYITDCSCDEQYFKLIPHIRLFDHHITAESLNKFSNATVKVELNKTATGNVSITLPSTSITPSFDKKWEKRYCNG